MHRTAPISERLRNHMWAGTMDMRNEGAAKIEEQEALIQAQAERIRNLEARVRVLESDKQSFPFGLRNRSAS